jgi:hypothetical protein
MSGFHATKVSCPDCRWRGHRTRRDDGTWGRCPQCDARVAPASVTLDRQLAKARSELQALARGARL